MDVRYMTLIDSPITEVRTSAWKDYAFDEERTGAIAKMLGTFLSGDPWDPAFVAWRPMLAMYLSSGCNASLTHAYYMGITEAPKVLTIASTARSRAFEDIRKVIQASPGKVFTDDNYADILNLVQRECKFFVGQEQKICNQLHAIQSNTATMNELLSREDWFALMCALDLYRHCQVDDFTWQRDIIAKLQVRLGEWLAIYLEEFDKARRFVFDHPIYTWYQDGVQQVMQKLWSSALILHGRQDVLSRDIVLQLPPTVATELVDAVNKSPAWYDEPFTDQATWDALCHVYVTADGEDPDFIIKAYHAHCVPRQRIARMVNILRDFYWMVLDKKLTQTLYDRMVCEWQSDSHTAISPDEYLQGLYERGFPSM